MSDRKRLTQEQILALHTTMTQKALEKIKRKGADYAGSQSNSLVTLRMSEVFSVHPGTGVMIRVTDKLQRIQSFITKGELQVKDEPVDDALEDIINYMVLIKALIAEEALNAQ